MSEIKPQDNFVLGRMGAPLVAAVIVAVAVYFYYQRYGDAESQYNRTVTQCVRARTILDKTSSAQEEATVACVRDTPGHQ
jgi:hypothetical protein